MAASLAVIVVGAGPTGLLAACELARRGVDFRLIDTLAAPTGQSRAIVVHARSLEMLDRVGVADEIIGSGVKTTGMRMHARGRELARIDLTDVASAFPFTVTTAQTETERILSERLRAVGGTVEREVTLTGLSQDAGGVTLTLRRGDGSEEKTTAAFVIGADGARSASRELAGTRLAGSFHGERFLLGDVEAAHDLDPSSMYTFFAPAGPVAVFPMAGSRVRVIAQVPGGPGPVDLSPARAGLQRILDERVGGVKVTASHWLTEFEIHHAQVPRYRTGRVFLAGDAAHIHSPAGGQGMNTGMQDTFNLAWKVDLAVAGQGGETLLDSYHAERHPIAAGVLKFSTALTKAATVRGELPTRLRNQIAHLVTGIGAVQHELAAATEEIRVAYRDSPVVTAARPPHARVRAGDHEAHLPDPDIRRRLRAVRGSASTGHTILTVAAAGGAPPAAPDGPAGTVRVLVADGETPVPGYDATVADPGRVVAGGYGLAAGGHVVIRPDGYVGFISALDGGTSGYFAVLAS